MSPSLSHAMLWFDQMAETTRWALSRLPAKLLLQGNPQSLESLHQWAQANRQHPQKHAQNLSGLPSFSKETIPVTEPPVKSRMEWWSRDLNAYNQPIFTRSPG